MNIVSIQACRDELIKIAESSILQQRAEDYWKAKSRAADKASSLPTVDRAVAHMKERSAAAARKSGGGLKKVLGLLRKV
jgi:hypothetical protein